MTCRELATEIRKAKTKQEADDVIRKFMNDPKTDINDLRMVANDLAVMVGKKVN